MIKHEELLRVDGLVYHPQSKRADFRSFIAFKKFNDKLYIIIDKTVCMQVVATYTLNNGAKSFDLIDTIDSIKNLAELSKNGSFDLNREITRVRNIFDKFEKNQIRVFG